ncbi:MAG: twin-arginine translocase TatA/TatE family subunit [Haloarculaceae archaeon]
MQSIVPAFIGGVGGPEMLIVLGIAILLFGANKLPELANSSGKALGEFKKGQQEIEEELREAARAESASEEPQKESA